MRLFLISISLLVITALKAQHPIAFASRSDFEDVKKGVAKKGLLQQSYAAIKADVDANLGKDIDVPFPKDPAGGYTHERHKTNYQLIFNSGVLYNITGDERYASLVKKILLKYAALNPTLKKHPQATSSSPGHIFWQALNDANWLVYTGLGYDLIYKSLTPTEKQTIEQGAFKPEVDFITKDLQSWFNLMHNHGVWACAGVGIVGIACNNKDYVQMALYGSGKDGKGGFMAQLDNLFSPDGYYSEGPYYVRYALLPFYLFSNALNNAQPGLKIFQHRNGILKKALMGGLQQTNTNGAFFPFNDALKDKDYTTSEMVMAVDIAWNVFGADPGLLAVAQKQDEVALNKGGAAISNELATRTSLSFPYRSVEFTDGAQGNEGGVSYLRAGKTNDLTTLAFKYSSHGLSHGHFDKLNFFLYDKGSEIFTDYGSARFVNVEQKWGGRYLPENAAYAMQTIAHNTIVVDETSQYGAKETESEKHHSEKLFSDITDPSVQVISAMENNAYADAALIRTLYLLQLPQNRIIVDLFHVQAKGTHQYDLPYQYSGQLINTTFKFSAAANTMQTLGKKNGYQFLWKEAEARVKDTLVQFTFLNDRTYYSISTLIQDSAQIFFTRTGANDPNFNLRREPAYIIRKNGGNQDFINVIEIHGQYNPVAEASSGSYPSVQQIQWLKNDNEVQVAQIIINKHKLLIVQAKKDFSETAKHTTMVNDQAINWTGPYIVVYDNQNLKIIKTSK